MKSCIAVLTSDWHLEQGAWKAPNTPKGDSYVALDQIVDLAVRFQVPVIAAGDLFDVNRPDSLSLHRASAAITQLGRYGQQLLFTQGQHEKSYPPFMSLFDGAVHIHQRVVEVRGINVVGIDHVSSNNLESSISQAETLSSDVDLLVVHQVWREFLGINFEASLSLPISKIRPKLVLSGDFHKHLSLPVDGVSVLSPGSTCLQDVKEPPVKSVFLLFDDMSVESRTLASRAVHVVDSVMSQDELLALIDRFSTESSCLPLEISQPVVIIKEPELLPYCEAANTAAVGKAFLFWRPKEKQDLTLVTVSQDTVRSMVRDGISSCIAALPVSDGSKQIVSSLLLEHRTRGTREQYLNSLLQQQLIEGHS